MSQVIYDIRDLCLTQGGKTLCRSLQLQVLPGQVWGLLGANGAGKSTLLHCLGGLHSGWQGQVSLLGRPLAQWPRRLLAQQLGLLLQDQPLSFPARLQDVVLQGRYPHQSLWQADTAEDQALLAQALVQADLTELAERRVDQLSGGERQRMAIASLLMQQAPILLLDEPSNHLDLHYQVRLLDILLAQSRRLEGACIASLHDLNLAVRFCSHLLLMLGEGEVVAGPVEAMLQEEYLHRVYKHCIVKIESPQGRAFLPG